MPVSHLSLRRGHSNAYLDAISESLHRALVECFEVPPDDRFQIIHQFDGHEMRFDRHYLAGPRSEDWLLIEITAGRPAAKRPSAASTADSPSACRAQPASLLAM